MTHGSEILNSELVRIKNTPTEVLLRALGAGLRRKALDAVELRDTYLKIKSAISELPPLKGEITDAHRIGQQEMRHALVRFQILLSYFGGDTFVGDGWREEAVIAEVESRGEGQAVMLLLGMQESAIVDTVNKIRDAALELLDRNIIRRAERVA